MPLGMLGPQTCALETAHAVQGSVPGFPVPAANKFPGGHRGGVTPVPIPNTEVKPSTADGTAGAGLWESRSLPGILSKRPVALLSTGPFLLYATSFRARPLASPEEPERASGKRRLAAPQSRLPEPIAWRIQPSGRRPLHPASDCLILPRFRLSFAPDYSRLSPLVTSPDGVHPVSGMRRGCRDERDHTGTLVAPSRSGSTQYRSIASESPIEPVSRAVSRVEFASAHRSPSPALPRIRRVHLPAADGHTRRRAGQPDRHHLRTRRSAGRCGPARRQP